MTVTSSVGDVVAALEECYDPAYAEPWDAVGLVCGDPGAAVSRVLFAVDPISAVVDEAMTAGAQLVVTHHPLFLGSTTSVAATTAKGRVVHRLVSNGIALYVAHTNADVASPGVSDALAETIGLHDVQALAPTDTAMDKVVVFTPEDAVDRVLDAMAAAGAGTIGDYTRCAYLGDGVGTFVAGAGALPTVDAPVSETRIEMIAPRSRRSSVLRAIHEAHPYEEPAYDVYELASLPDGRGPGRGLGRIGRLPAAMSLEVFTRHVADALPSTAAGVRAAGDRGRSVQSVAVCGGSGGDVAGRAAALGADVLVTADLKHHATSEAVDELGIALVDAAHWATEWPWLQQAAGVVADTVETTVSTIVTDPWNVHHRKDS